jgi:hypothetical protein
LCHLGPAKRGGGHAVEVIIGRAGISDSCFLFALEVCVPNPFPLDPLYHNIPSLSLSLSLSLSGRFGGRGPGGRGGRGGRGQWRDRIDRQVGSTIHHLVLLCPCPLIHCEPIISKYMHADIIFSFRPPPVGRPPSPCGRIGGASRRWISARSPRAPTSCRAS